MRFMLARSQSAISHDLFFGRFVMRIRLAKVFALVLAGVSGCWSASVLAKAYVAPPANPSGGAVVTMDTIIVTADRILGGANSSGGITGVDVISVGGFERENNYETFKDNEGQSEDEQENPGKDCPKSGNPVVLANGNKIETDVDFVSAGDVPLRLARTWNRYSLYSARLFETWLTDFDGRLYYNGCGAYPGEPECSGTPFGAIWVQRADGRSIRYIKNTDGIYYETKANPVSKAILQSDGTWTLYTENRGVERYTKGGLIKEIKNEQGIGWTFLYGGTNNTLLQRVTHTNGRYIEFTWAPKNTQYGFGPRVIRVRSPRGDYFDYTYTQDAYGRLKTATLPGAPITTITYHYGGEAGEVGGNSFGVLVGKSYNGVRYSTFAYDAAGKRAIETRHAGNVERFAFAYTEGANGELTTVETNPLGKQATYKFLNDKLVSITGQPSAHCASSFRDITYDANGYDDIVKDFKGNISDYDYDAHGHLQRKVEALGKPEARTTTYGWDEAGNRLLRSTIAGLNETTYVYDATGRARSIAVKNLSATGVANQVQTTSYSYALQTNGLVGTIMADGPIAGNADAVTTAYSPTGDVTEVTNSLGHATVYSGYNGLGQPGSVTGPNGDKNDFVYDARGRVVQEKTNRNGATQTKTYVYDGFGRLAAVVLPDGQRHSYQYDVAGRLVAESEPEGGGAYAQTVYAYNAMSKPVSIKTQRVFTQPLEGTQP